MAVANAVASEQMERIAVLAGKYLTFQLGDETFGINLLNVQEIIGLQKITCMPRTPVYIRGVINLRGSVIPVIDLRTRFEMDAVEDTEKTVIIVVQIPTDDGVLTTGLVVDQVSEVLNIAVEELEPLPSFGDDVKTESINAIGKIDRLVVMLLDLHHVVGRRGVEIIEEEQIN